MSRGESISQIIVKDVIPDIHVSLDASAWFSIFKPQEMFIFGQALAGKELRDGVPYYYMRVQPDSRKLEFTPTMSIFIGRIN